MTDINIDGVIDFLDRSVPRPGITIAEVPIDLARDQQIVELKLRAPGLIRSATFWGKKPTVLGANIRRTEIIPMPLLFVECDPDGELQDRVLLFLPSNARFAPRAGFETRYVTTAVGPPGAVHVLEILPVAP